MSPPYTPTVTLGSAEGEERGGRLGVCSRWPLAVGRRDERRSGDRSQQDFIEPVGKFAVSVPEVLELPALSILPLLTGMQPAAMIRTRASTMPRA